MCFLCRAGRKLLEGFATMSDGNTENEECNLQGQGNERRSEGKVKVARAKDVKVRAATPVKRKRDVTDSSQLSGRVAEEELYKPFHLKGSTVTMCVTMP